MNKLKEIPYDYIEKVITFIACIVIIGMPLTHLLVSYRFVIADYVPALLYVSSIIFLIIDFLVFLNKNVKVEKQFVYYLLAGITFISIIAVIGANSYKNGFLGFMGRYEGVLSLASYYLLLINTSLLKNTKYKDFIVKFFFGFALIHCIYGLIQVFDIIPVFGSKVGAVSGFTGNQNFMGSLTVMYAGMAASYFYFSKNLKERIIYLLLLFVFLITLFLTKTMSAYFGLGIMVIAFFIFLFITRKHQVKDTTTIFSSWNMMISLIVLGCIGFLGLNMYLNNALLADVTVVINELVSMIITGKVDASFGSGRFVVWDQVLQLIKAKPIFGVGVDNLGPSIYVNFGLSNGVYFDKAHNEFLQIAATQGIPCLIMYLTMYYYVIKSCLLKIMATLYNEKDNEQNLSLYVGIFIVIIGYLAQAFFNISMPDVVPPLWIFMGIACSGKLKVRRVEKFDKPKFTLLPNGEIIEISERAFWE